MKTNKASGPDGITPRLLGAGETSIAVPLTNLYLRSLREAKVYNDWKLARLNPIFSQVEELSPLSMLSVPIKILESCVIDSIVEHVLTRNQLVTEISVGLPP